ncbi:DUF374 domain-containing protein [uncultured Bilophila sp.]|uniref:LpxL/LpxP family acyltransferase n=1 Tax=uncultured Bilophila sp. TaxID=529385 RepID=UPI0034C67296
MSRSGNSLMSLLSAPVYRLYRLWCRSLRYTEINRAAIETTADLGRPVVLSLWHDELFPLIYLKRRLNIIALVSQSDDGDLLAGVLERMGLETARGSSSRGGVKALLAAARRMREAGLCGCVTVDGPRGPRHEVKEGAIFLACRADAPIVPIRLFMERRKLFRSWDRFQLPLPFSRVTMVCGDAYRVECDLHDPDAVARECRRLEDILNGLTPPETKPEPSPFQRFGTLLSDTTCRVSYGFARLIAKLGFSGIRSFGKGLGAAFWACLPSRRRLAAGNIASHLDLSPATAESLARASFTHNARSFLEAVLAPDFGLDHPLLDVERPDLLERLKRGERPAVITTGHFGAWELLASLLGDVSDHPRLTVVRTYKNRVLHYVSTRLRSSRGAEVFGHREAAFPVLRALRKNGYAAFLADHNTSRSEAVFLPFLGEEAAVNKGPAVLAVRGKALVWPIYLMRDGDRYRLVIEEPLDTLRLEGDADAKTLAVAELYTDSIARMVRRAPDQWFWMHNRWKTKRVMDD